MSDKYLYLEIVTPSKIIFSGNVEKVTVPGELGSFQILFNHAPIMSNLTIGEVKVETETGEVIRFAVDSGFVFVLKNRITIVSDSLVSASEIDVKNVQEELLKLKEEIKEKRKFGNVETLEIKIAQLENRIKIASKVI